MAIPLAAIPSIVNLFRAMKDNSKIIAGVVFLLAVSLYVMNLRSDRDEWKRMYEVGKLAVVTAQLNIETLKNSVEKQNSDIKRLELESEIANQRLREKDVQREQMKAGHQKQLQDLSRAEKPVTCQATIDYMVDSVEQLK